MPQRSLPFDPIEEAAGHWRTHGWPEAACGMAAVTSIMRAQQLLMGRAEALLKPYALSFARYEVLMLLSFSSRGALPLGKIGERLQVDPASVTNVIDRLEASDLVQRKPNPLDGRGVLASITEKGRRLADEATQALNAQLFSAVGLSEESLGVLFRVLQDFRHAAGDFD